MLYLSQIRIHVENKPNKTFNLISYSHNIHKTQSLDYIAVLHVNSNSVGVNASENGQRMLFWLIIDR